MRITAQMIVDSAIKQMETNRQRLLETQERVSLNRSFTKPSQDPLGVAKAMEINSLLDRLDQYDKSVDSATAFLEENERALNAAYDLLTEAWEISLANASTGDAEGRQIAAGQVSLLRDQLVSQANSKIGDRYLFGGYETGSQPFDSSGNYSGDNGSIQIRISPNSNMTINFTGDVVFKGAGGKFDVFDIVNDLQTALETSDIAGINQAQALLSLAIDQIVDFQTQAGVRLNRLETAKNDLTEMSFQMEDLMNDTIGVDITRMAADLASQRTLFEASVAATAQVLQISLLAFIS
jgi:flagellar hook-associated protein 3 FlgL